MQLGAFDIERSYPTHCNKLPLAAESPVFPTSLNLMNLESNQNLESNGVDENRVY